MKPMMRRWIATAVILLVAACTGDDNGNNGGMGPDPLFWDIGSWDREVWQ